MHLPGIGRVGVGATLLLIGLGLETTSVLKAKPHRRVRGDVSTAAYLVRVRISKRSRQKFADYAAGWGSLAKIRDVFASEDFMEPADYEGPETGVRRALVAAIHSTISEDDAGQQLRLARVYANAIDDWTQPGYNDVGAEYRLPADALALIRSMRRDGVDIDDNGEARIPQAPDSPVTLPLGRYDRLSRPEVLLIHLNRISDNLAKDPPAAIGSAKELVESTCKFVLDDYGKSYSRRDSLTDLFKAAAEALEISRESVKDNARGSAIAKKALQNLASIVQSLAELRNELGLGHGHTTPSAAIERHARLAFNAARTVVEFMLDTWHYRKQQAGGDT